MAIRRLQWQTSTVIPITKPSKDKTDPLSYRPTALTSCICKVMESMINNRLVWYLEKNKLITSVQCGFRKQRGRKVMAAYRHEPAGSWYACVCVAVGLVGGGGSPPPGPWPWMLSPTGWLPRVRDQFRPPTLDYEYGYLYPGCVDAFCIHSMHLYLLVYRDEVQKMPFTSARVKSRVVVHNRSVCEINKWTQCTTQHQLAAHRSWNTG